MADSRITELASRLQRLHETTRPLVLPTVWDASSAQPGYNGYVVDCDNEVPVLRRCSHADATRAAIPASAALPQARGS